MSNWVISFKRYFCCKWIASSYICMFASRHAVEAIGFSLPQ